MVNGKSSAWTLKGESLYLKLGASSIGEDAPSGTGANGQIYLKIKPV
jgi:hypothetical protein